MNTEKCIGCEKDSPEFKQQFLVVNVETSSDTAYSRSYKTKTTETTVKETFVGTDSCAICAECVKRARKRDTLVDMLTVLVGAVFCTLVVPRLFLLMMTDLNDAEKTLIKSVFLAIMAALGVLAILLIMVSRLRMETPFVIARLYKRRYGHKDGGNKYIPLQGGLYCKKRSTIPDLELFKKKTGLKTHLAEELFYRYIASGDGGRAATET